MNLLEIVILHIFLMLFSVPANPTAGDEAKAKSVETCGVDGAFRGARGTKYTRELLHTESGLAVEAPTRKKHRPNSETVVSRPEASSSKSGITRGEASRDASARIKSNPSSIIFPK